MPVDPSNGVVLKSPWNLILSPKILGSCVLLSYAGVCFTLWLLQDEMIYEGMSSLPLPKAIENAAKKDLIPLNDPTGKLIGYIPNKNFTPTRGTAVVFHGKGGHASSRSFYVPALEKQGYRVVLVEYPGYGGRDGRPSEAEIVAEGRALIRRLDASGQGPITLWGESLGTGVACSVAADPTLPITGLVLITPFDSLEHIAASRFPYVPVSFLLRDRYYSAQNVANFQHPVVLVQAEQDLSVPAWSTDILYNALPAVCRKRIVLPNCTHTNWPNTPEQSWWTEAANFVSPR